MDKVSLLNINNEKFDVAVIRFFSLGINNYFIYSMNEIDEQNYIKLYTVKITTDIYGMSSSNITDENEWLAVKEMIKTIVKENKEGNRTVIDEDYRKLENIKISESRVFKLSVPLVELLQANKKNFTPSPEVVPLTNDSIVASVLPNVAPVIPTVPVAPMVAQPTTEQMPDVDYHAMYVAEKANNQRLTMEIEELKNKINTIKNML